MKFFILKGTLGVCDHLLKICAPLCILFHIPHNRFIPRAVSDSVIFYILCVLVWHVSWYGVTENTKFWVDNTVGCRPASILSPASGLSPLSHSLYCLHKLASPS